MSEVKKSENSSKRNKYNHRNRHKDIVGEKRSKEPENNAKNKNNPPDLQSNDAKTTHNSVKGAVIIKANKASGKESSNHDSLEKKHNIKIDSNAKNERNGHQASKNTHNKNENRSKENKQSENTALLTSENNSSAANTRSSTSIAQSSLNKSWQKLRRDKKSRDNQNSEKRSDDNKTVNGFTNYSDLSEKSGNPSREMNSYQSPELILSQETYEPCVSDVEYGKERPFTDFSSAFNLSGYESETPSSVNVKSGQEEDKNDELATVIGIRFRSSGKIYYFDPDGINYQADTFAIVDTARGIEYGYVALGNHSVPLSSVVIPLRKAIRPATKADKEHFAENCKKEVEASQLWSQKVAQHELAMKLVDVEYTFDNSKLLFYFTAEGRVDFRDLVKDLASLFRCRIELRQMGIRDEAKMLGGLGICGRPLCCATFLPDFAQVSIKMAKEQTISLNSAKISGNCGRLMCCLRFEHDTYSEAIKRTPAVNSIVATPQGEGVIVESKPLLELVKVKLNSNPDAVPSVFKLDDIKIIKREEMQFDDADDKTEQ